MIKEREIEAKALALDKSVSELSEDNDAFVPQRSQSSVTKDDRKTRR